MKKITLLMLFTTATAFASQKFTVKVIDRQDNSTGYVYVVPGHSETRIASGVGCSANDISAACVGLAEGHTTSTQGYASSYEVTGATLSLELPDGRIAVVNCSAKINKWALAMGVAARRSCRVPPRFLKTIGAEFNGNKAKLEWSVSIDGKATESETYKLLGVSEQ